MKTKHFIILILITIITLLTLTSINATNTTDTQHNIQQNTTQILKDTTKTLQTTTEQKIVKTNTKTIKKEKETQNSTTNIKGYTQLTQQINTIKKENQTKDYESVNLTHGNYNITQPINWGNSNTKTMKIYANNNLFDAQNQTNFITVEKGYTLELYNFKIRYAKSNTNGAVINNQGTINIYDSIFLNSSAINGGVIYNTGTIKILNSSFSNNNATNGGVIYNTGIINITKSYFSYNSAKNGAVNYNYGTLNITSTILKYNKAYENGGVNMNLQTLRIQSSDIYNNQAIRGAVNANYKILIINKTTLKQNTATKLGGCNYNNRGIINIYDSTLDMNTAENGGCNFNNKNAIINIQKAKHQQNTAKRGAVNYNFGNMTIKGSNHSSNTATINGGVNYNDHGRIIIKNVKSVQNKAQRAANTYNNNGYIQINESKFVDEKAQQDADVIINYANTKSEINQNTFITTQHENHHIILTNTTLILKDNQIQLTNKQKITINQTLTIKLPYHLQTTNKKQINYTINQKQYKTNTTTTTITTPKLTQIGTTTIKITHPNQINITIKQQVKYIENDTGCELAIITKIPCKNGKPDLSKLDDTYKYADENRAYTITSSEILRVMKLDSYSQQIYGFVPKYTFFREESSNIKYIISREKWNVIARALNEYHVKKGFYAVNPPYKLVVNLTGKIRYYPVYYDSQEWINGYQYTCGPTSMSMISQALNCYSSERKLSGIYKTTSYDGTSESDIIKYSPSVHMKLTNIANTKTSLINALQSGSMILWHIKGHYMCIIGYNLQSDRFLCLNPSGPSHNINAVQWATWTQIKNTDRALKDNGFMKVTPTWTMTTQQKQYTQNYYNNMGGKYTTPCNFEYPNNGEDNIVKYTV